MKEKNRVLIIGGGASGLFAAITAAEHGAEVVVLEKEKKAGRKILKTGNGRCNFTNVGSPSHVYHGTEREFASQVLSRFTPQDTIMKFTSLGIFTTNRNDWIYPHSETAESVLTTLLWRAAELRVKIKCNETVTKIGKSKECFTVYTETWHYEADKVIIACGSAASLTEKQLPLRSYELAAMMGHSVIEPLPALVPLKVKNAGSFKWGGVRINAAVNLYVEDLFIANASGQVQLTDSGISGIPVFAVSGQALRLLEGGLNVLAKLDFFPEMPTSALCDLLQNRKEQHPDRKAADLLVGMLPERLIHAVIQRTSSRIREDGYARSEETDVTGSQDNGEPGKDDPFRRSEIRVLAEVIKEFEVTVTGSQGFAFAQCAAGGIPTREVDPATCESKSTKGLYLTGEMLDIDGECGGWNLQFAWSTGYLAGKSAAEAL